MDKFTISTAGSGPLGCVGGKIVAPFERRETKLGSYSVVWSEKLLLNGVAG